MRFLGKATERADERGRERDRHELVQAHRVGGIVRSDLRSRQSTAGRDGEEQVQITSTGISIDSDPYRGAIPIGEPLSAGFEGVGASVDEVNDALRKDHRARTGRSDFSADPSRTRAQVGGRGILRARCRMCGAGLAPECKREAVCLER